MLRNIINPNVIRIGAMRELKCGFEPRLVTGRAVILRGLYRAYALLGVETATSSIAECKSVSTEVSDASFEK